MRTNSLHKMRKEKDPRKEKKSSELTLTKLGMTTGQKSPVPTDTVSDFSRPFWFLSRKSQIQSKNG